jgi:hypothetical protein
MASTYLLDIIILLFAAVVIVPFALTESILILALVVLIDRYLLHPVLHHINAGFPKAVE